MRFVRTLSSPPEGHATTHPSVGFVVLISRACCCNGEHSRLALALFSVVLFSRADSENIHTCTDVIYGVYVNYIFENRNNFVLFTFGCVEERRLAVALNQHAEVATLREREHGRRPGRGANARARGGIEGHGVAGDLNPRGRVGLVGAARKRHEILGTGIHLGWRDSGWREAVIAAEVRAI